MFDHIYRVKGWTTMVCRIYNHVLHRVMTVAICDMQTEDADSQCLLWYNLNNLMKNHGISNINFKGSWQIVPMPMSLVFKGYLVMEIPKSPYRVGNVHVVSIGSNLLKNIRSMFRSPWERSLCNWFTTLRILSSADEDTQLSMMKLKHWIQMLGACSCKD